MHHNAEEVFRKNIFFMTSRNVSWICIAQMIKLCAWVTLMDMLVGILMVKVECKEDMV